MATLRETTNFKYREWQCKCGCDQPHQMKANVMENVQKIRELYGKPLTLTSAWRCKNHSSEKKKKVPGQHNRGTAVDIAISDGVMAYKLITLGLSLGATGFALGNGFVHLDWRVDTPVTWKY